MMRYENHIADARGRAGWGVPSVAAFLAVSFLYGGALLFTRYSGPLLERAGQGVGEVLMKEGQHLETGGDPQGAETAYRAALAAGFAGLQNRTFTEKRLGTLLWQAGRLEEALPHLEAAVSLRPGTELLAYAPLCATLLALGRHAELEHAAQDWKKAAGTNAKVEAEACYFLGKAAQAQGNELPALESFKEGAELAPGSLASGALGLFHFERKQYEEARPHLEAYLLLGTSGKPEDDAIRNAYQALPISLQGNAKP